MECPICLQKIENATICSCVHHFCNSCIIEWCKINSFCPVCKEFICELRRDNEFDILNKSNISKKDNINEISINMTKGTHPGISLENNYKGPGVKVVKLVKKDQFYKHGVRVNSIIIYINNIPCINHKQSIDVINNLSISNKNIKLTFLK